jgi:hypothetical protein
MSNALTAKPNLKNWVRSVKNADTSSRCASKQAERMNTVQSPTLRLYKASERAQSEGRQV